MNSIIFVVTDENHPTFTDSYPMGGTEFSWIITVRPKGVQALYIQRINNYTVVGFTAYIQIIFVDANVIRGHSFLPSERFPSVTFADLAWKPFDVAPIWSEHLDVLVVRVTDVHIAIWSTGDTNDVTELPHPSSFAADGLVKGEVSIEHLDTRQISQVDLLVDTIKG